MEITAESGAVMAATLANGGLNPLTGDPVLTVDAIRNTLTLMHSCGMYNYSGQFAFQVSSEVLVVDVGLSLVSFSVSLF